MHKLLSYLLKFAPFIFLELVYSAIEARKTDNFLSYKDAIIKSYQDDFKLFLFAIACTIIGLLPAIYLYEYIYYKQFPENYI